MAQLHAFAFSELVNAEEVGSTLQLHGITLTIAPAKPWPPGAAGEAVATSPTLRHILSTTLKVFGDAHSLRRLETVLPWRCVCSCDSYRVQVSKGSDAWVYPRDRSIYCTTEHV
jgi:hypothetical protein